MSNTAQSQVIDEKKVKKTTERLVLYLKPETIQKLRESYEEYLPDSPFHIKFNQYIEMLLNGSI